MPEHTHEWKMVSHLDGCHHYSTTSRCECGAVRVARNERDAREDPYSLLWFLNDCDRCMELMNGADPLHSVDVEVPA